MGAAQSLHIPGFAAVLFRRTKPLLSRPGGLISRAERWWANSRARWVDDESTWYFPCDGGGYSSITFGYMEHEKDKFNWLAFEFQFIGFDELTEFSESMYKFLFNRLRMTVEMEKSGLHLTMASASNPGNIGHEWVRSRFILQELWPDGKPYYEEDVELELHPPLFIPARLEDNPHVHKQSYLRSLGHMDPITRQQYLKGNWDAASGGAQLRREWFKVMSVLPVSIVFGIRHWDIAATVPIEGSGQKADWTAGALILVDADGRLIIHDIQRFQGTPGTVEDRIYQQAHADLILSAEHGFPVITTMEQEPGASGKIVIDHYTHSVLAGFPFEPIRSTGKKEVRSIPLANEAEAGNVYVYVPAETPEDAKWMRKFFDEVDLYPWGDHDDQVDAVAGATNKALVGGFLHHAVPLVRNKFSWKTSAMSHHLPSSIPGQQVLALGGGSSWRTR